MSLSNDFLSLYMKWLYRPIGRLLFGKKFDSGPHIEPLWKRFIMSLIMVAVIWLALTAVLLIVSYVFGIK